MGPATLDDVAAAVGGHTSAEAVGTDALDAGRLVGTKRLGHWISSSSGVSRRERRGGYGAQVRCRQLPRHCSWVIMLFLPVVFAVAAAAGAADRAPTPPSADAGTPGTAVVTRSRVLVLATSGDLDPAKRLLLTDLTAARLARFANLEIIAARDIEARLGLEASKQAAGCDSDASCLANLTGALDVDVVCATSAGTLGGTTVFTLQLVDNSGTARARGSVQVSALDDLATAVSRVIDDAGRAATGDEPSDAVVRVAGTTAAAANAAAFGSLRQPVLVAGAVGLGVGVTVLGLGLVPAVLANGSESDLTRLRVRYVDSGGDPAILDQAASKQAEVDDRRALWNNVGLYAAWTGALVAIAGGAAIAAAVTLIDDETEVQP